MAGSAENAGKDSEAVIFKYTADLSIVGDIEYTSYDNLLTANFHYMESSGSLTNRLIAFDLASDKELLNIVLNTNAVMFVPDSFFIYKNSLILIKEKKEVFVYKIVT